jgi:hypothetical protein
MEIEGLMKRCARCKDEKDESNFWTNKSRKDGLASSCKNCINEMASAPGRLEKRRQYNAKTKHHAQEYQLKKKFGIDANQYDKLLLSQNGKCAICETPKCRYNRRFAVDHDHNTGQIRGLLCGQCNTAIGLLQSDSNPAVIEKAVTYLRKTR